MPKINFPFTHDDCDKYLWEECAPKRHQLAKRISETGWSPEELDLRGAADGTRLDAFNNNIIMTVLGVLMYRGEVWELTKLIPSRLLIADYMTRPNILILDDLEENVVSTLEQIQQWAAECGLCDMRPSPRRRGHQSAMRFHDHAA